MPGKVQYQKVTPSRQPIESGNKTKKTSPVTSPNLRGRNASLSTGIKLAGAVASLAIVGAIWYAYTQTQSTPQPAPIEAATIQPSPTIQAQPFLMASANLTAQKIQMLANHVHPGLQLVGDGGCVIESTALSVLKTESNCHDGLQAMKQAIRAQGIENQVYLERAFNKLGIRVASGKDNFLVGLNPEIRQNYKAGLSLAKKEMGKPDFFARTTQDIIAVWKKIHKTMLGHLPEITPGTYRTDCVMIFHDDTPLGRTVYQLHTDNLNAAGVSEKDIDYAWRSLEAGSFCNLSDRAKSIWSKIASFTCHPDEVPTQMAIFVDKLKQIVAADEDPVAIAAKAHQELVGIHPWTDGNGRFARLIMNQFLPTPVVFPSDPDYQAAVTRDRNGLGSFEEYLRTTIIPWNKKAQSKLAG